ncbi:MAG TPA: antibiotic biosynthesis monooxygenase family protein [Gemmatimonadaceae bacterium]|nr:antibiotic biosynthesis monooxygenase family protein [Gemmatimonadaceae bacterium]
MSQTQTEYGVVWAFRVRPGAAAEFERLYGPDGDWVRLFRRSPGYLGTELWRDADVTGRYVTIDRWRSRADCEGFIAGHAQEYAEIDARGARLTDFETRLTRLER